MENFWELMLVLMVFILGLLIGLIIDTLKKRRYNRLSAKVLQNIYRSSDMDMDMENSDFGPYPYKGFTPPPGAQYRSVQDTRARRYINTADIIVERDDGKEDDHKDLSGKWICHKCGAMDATLIHRKGCDKCSEE